MFEHLKGAAKEIKKDLIAFYLLYKNPKVKPLPKIIIAIALGYALSPIDLIPDFIPVLGYLDDLFLIPLLFTLSLKLVPAEIVAEAREEARINSVSLPHNWIAGGVIILIWFIVTVWFIRLFIE